MRVETNFAGGAEFHGCAVRDDLAGRISGASDLGVGWALMSRSPTRTWRDCDRLWDEAEVTLKSEVPVWRRRVFVLG
jgi:hypothetical protein